MSPQKYLVTESTAGFIEGETLTVIDQKGHANEMVLELQPFAADPVRVIVSERVTGFSQRNILEASSRFGDWHQFSLTFDTGSELTGDAVDTDGPVQLTKTELSSIAEPVDTAA